MNKILTPERLRIMYPMTARWRAARWAKAVNRALFWWYPKG